jgi:hypothetical protein
MLLERMLGFITTATALASFASAGILTVGPAGSGAQYTQIQSAIDAAQTGDVILVGPGTYAAIDVAKALRILGDGTGPVRIASIGAGVVAHDVGAGQELVLSGLEVQGESAALVRVADCAGTVVLQGLTLLDRGFEVLGVELDRCARVLLLDSRISGGTQEHSVGGAVHGAVVVRSSELWVANASIAGSVLYGDLFNHASSGIDSTSSTLHVWSSQVQGGDLTYQGVGSDLGPGGSGILAVGSSLDLFGGPGAGIRGGKGTIDFLTGSSPGGPGIELRQGSRATISQNQFLQGGLDGRGGGRAPEIRSDASSSFTLPPRIFPTLASSAPAVRRGSSFTLSLAGNAGAHQVLYFALRTGPTTTYPGVLGFGLVGSSTFPVANVLVPSSGTASFGVLVPNVPALLGATLFFQSVEHFGAKYAIGNPVLVTVSG